MFSNNQDNQSSDAQTHTDMDQVAAEVSEQPQPIGLGINPSTMAAPAPNPDPTPTPVLPTPPTESQESSESSEPEIIRTDQQDHSAPAPSSNAPAGGLEDIKKQAIEQLSPLVDKIDQAPEEKYKTIMTLIQASDNKDMIPAAYEAAQKITDEKIKAEALLNIVNEINYFTQKSEN